MKNKQINENAELMLLFIEIDVHLNSGYVSPQQPPTDKDK